MARNRGITAQAIPLSGTELTQAAADSELIVNCTTIGMTHGPGEDETPLPGNAIPSTALVNDLVYNPLETRLLREAAQAGARTLGGIQMLVYQGAASFEMWLERPAPVEVMMSVAIQSLQSSR